jgi:ferredoxin-thioredoxin reductase catalytic subunit
MKSLSAEEARSYAAQVARHRGWAVNPDEGMTATLVGGLSRQSERYGRPYCPCRDVDGLESDADVICPCAYAAADIAEHGQCYCALFLSPLKDPSTVQSIPERRP